MVLEIAYYNAHLLSESDGVQVGWKTFPCALAALEAAEQTCYSANQMTAPSTGIETRDTVAVDSEGQYRTVLFEIGRGPQFFSGERGQKYNLYCLGLPGEREYSLTGVTYVRYLSGNHFFVQAGTTNEESIPDVHFSQARVFSGFQTI